MIQIHTNNPLFEPIRKFCISLPVTTEDIKWDKDLVFSVHNKMFCVAMIEEPFTISFKCSPQDAEFLIQKKELHPLLISQDTTGFNVKI